VLRGILGGRTRAVPGGELVLAPVGPRLTPEELDALDSLPVWVVRSGRDTLSVAYGEEYILKTFRRVEDGVSPAVEVGRYLATRPGYTGFAPLAGSIEYRRRGSEPATLDVLYKYVPHQGTAWQYALDELSRYFERVAALSREAPPRPPDAVPLHGNGHADDPGEWHELAGGFVESVRLLGRRTAEMHAALASPPHTAAFAPEPFGKLYQRSIYQTMRNMTGKLCRRLEQVRHRLPEVAREPAARLLALEHDILRRFREVLNPALGGYRVRVHGDYHLARVLYTGKDFVVADFEGEPGRTVEDRRVKRSPLRDVASMVRSFDYAVQVTLLGLGGKRGRPQGVIRDEDVPKLGPWAEGWYHRVGREFVTAYLDAVGPAGVVPAGAAERRGLLEMFVLEKALHEVEAELVRMSEKVVIPLRGILRMMEPAGEPAASE
jgi:maltose alpha-D-glucosyltransferase/alpha-amylase